MKDLLKYLKGKKTYIITVSAAILAVLDNRGIITIPNDVWYVLSAAGLAALRAGVDKAKNDLDA